MASTTLYLVVNIYMSTRLTVFLRDKKRSKGTFWMNVRWWIIRIEDAKNYDVNMLYILKSIIWKPVTFLVTEIMQRNLKYIY